MSAVLVQAQPMTSAQWERIPDWQRVIVPTSGQPMRLAWSDEKAAPVLVKVTVICSKCGRERYPWPGRNPRQGCSPDHWVHCIRPL